jgi:hypothetical protein
MLAAVAELERSGKVLDLVAAAIGAADVVRGVLALQHEARSPVFVVYGHEQGDSEASCWVAAASRSKMLCAALADDLNGLVARFGVSLGKPDLVGLEPLERGELASYVRGKDPLVRVGRHGVRWSIDSIRMGR